MKKYLLFLLGFIPVVALGQEIEKDSVSDYVVKMAQDSVFTSSIPLEEVYIFGRLEFDDQKERLRYYVLRRKTLKVYPYAKLAADRLVELNDSLTKFKKKRLRKKYTKEVQKYIEGEFSDELKKLTRTEGQILIKLIHRQTGKTAFELVKELRSGWRAFWYSTTARTFNIRMKQEFQPELVHEDYLIEDILQRAFAYDRLERQKSKLDYDYANLSNKWKKQQAQAPQ